MKPFSERHAMADEGVSAPLKGKRIVVTRPLNQAAEIGARLKSLGAEVLSFPAIVIKPPKSFKPLDEAIARIQIYDWIIFTSVNGVKFFFERVAKKMPGRKLMDIRRRGGDSGPIRIAAIGPATAAALSVRGVTPDFVPEVFLTDEISRGMKRISGKRVLLPRADIAPETLQHALTTKGAIVDAVVAYRTVLPAATARKALGRFDVIAFTSSSTVANFILGDIGRFPLSEKKAVIACIGPRTAATAREHGLAVHIQAKEHTVHGLVDAILAYFKEDGGGTHAG